MNDGDDDDDDDDDELERFYAALKCGTTVEDFIARHERILPFIHSTGRTSDHRKGKGNLKRLSDEITPAARFVKKYAPREDRIQFPLDNSDWDCNVCHKATDNRKIQITIIQARERINLMQELNESGSGRGFLGLTDDRETKEFRDAMSRERSMYSTEEAQRAILHAVALCLEKKNKKGNKGADTLLIEAPLDTLPEERWLEIRHKLIEMATPSAFNEVYLVGRGDNSDICMKLKP